MINEDNCSYFKFTGRPRLDKAIHTLEGLLKGIAADDVISAKELLIVRGWLAEHEEFADRHPFSEIIPLLTRVLTDDRMTNEEHSDLAWLCNRINTGSIYFDQVTSDMQRLHGLIAGIAFDGEINKEELEGLQTWLETHQDLRTCWPYDELDAIITSTLADGAITKEEHQGLMEFFSDFASHAGHRSIELPEIGESLLVKGVCAVCPDITLEGSQLRFHPPQVSMRIVVNRGSAPIAPHVSL